MAKRYFNEVYVRTATTPFSTIAYSALASSPWTKIPGEVADKTKTNLADDGKELMGDGSEYVSGEQTAPEIVVKNFTAANYATIRSLLLNAKVDVLLIDTEQKSPALVSWGVRLYPKPDFESGVEPTITIAGTRKAGAGITNTPMTAVTIT